MTKDIFYALHTASIGGSHVRRVEFYIQCVLKIVLGSVAGCKPFFGLHHLPNPSFPGFFRATERPGLTS